VLRAIHPHTRRFANLIARGTIDYAEKLAQPDPAETDRDRRKDPQRVLRGIHRPAPRERLRHHARELPEARAAVLHPGGGHRVRAVRQGSSRIFLDSRREGGRDGHHPEPQGRPPEASRRRSPYDQDRCRRGGPRQGGRHRHRRPRGGPQPRPPHRHPHDGRQDEGRDGREDGQGLRDGQARARPRAARGHHQHRRHLLAHQEGELHRQPRPRGPDHRF